MKTFFKRFWLGIMGAFLALGGLAACSRGHDAHQWPLSAEKTDKYRTKIVERAGCKLDLNEAQKARLGTLTDKLHEQANAIATKALDPRAEMLTWMAEAKFDKARAQATIDEKLNAVRSKSPEVIAAAGDFFDSLDAAQQTKLREYLQKRQGWFGHH